MCPVAWLGRLRGVGCPSVCLSESPGAEQPQPPEPGGGHAAQLVAGRAGSPLQPLRPEPCTWSQIGLGLGELAVPPRLPVMSPAACHPTHQTMARQARGHPTGIFSNSGFRAKCGTRPRFVSADKPKPAPCSALLGARAGVCGAVWVRLKADHSLTLSLG